MTVGFNIEHFWPLKRPYWVENSISISILYFDGELLQMAPWNWFWNWFYLKSWISIQLISRSFWCCTQFLSFRKRYYIILQGKVSVKKIEQQKMNNKLNTTGSGWNLQLEWLDRFIQLVFKKYQNNFCVKTLNRVKSLF